MDIAEIDSIQALNNSVSNNQMNMMQAIVPVIDVLDFKYLNRTQKTSCDKWVGM